MRGEGGVSERGCGRKTRIRILSCLLEHGTWVRLVKELEERKGRI